MKKNGRERPSSWGAGSGRTKKRKKKKEGRRKNNDRDLSNLFVFPGTLNCALAHRCVSCAYKIVLGSSGDIEMVGNVRPEMCPRISGEKPPTPFQTPRKKGSRYLVVGDGDFSFSRSLCILGKSLVATSLDSREENVEKYHNAETLDQLERNGVKVVHGVDATCIADTLRPKKLLRKKFDVVVFNFPCIPADADGQNAQMEANKSLVRSFGASALGLLSPGGQVLLTHKTRPPFSHWGIESLMNKSGFILVGRIVFDRAMFPPYRTRKALHLKSFPVSDAETYVFASAQEVRLALDSGNPLSMAKGGIAVNTNQLVLLTEELVQLIRQTHRKDT